MAPEHPACRPAPATAQAAPQTLSTAALTALGLGCYLGWQTIDISPTLFPAPGPGVRDALSSWGYAATACLIALLVLFALLARRRGPLLARLWVVGIASLGPAVGTAVLYLSGWVSDPPLLAGVVAGRLCYAMSAGFVVLWGELIARTRISETLATVAAGYGVSFGFCLLVANLDPTAALVFRPILPLLSGAVLVVLRHDLVVVPRALDPARPSLDRRPLPKLPLRLFMGIGLFGAIITATNHLSETKTAVSTEYYTLVAGIAVSLLLVALGFATRRRHKNFGLAYRLITPLVIGCLLLTLVLEPGSQRYEALAIGFAWAFFRIFTWTLWGRLGSRDPERAACVFACGQVVLTLCSTFAELICTVVNLSTLPLAGAAAAIIFAAVVTSALMVDEGTLTKLFSPRSGAAENPAELEGSTPQPTPAAGTRYRLALDPESVTPEEVARATAPFELSEREREIALLVLLRQDNASICRQTFITESTLRTHLRNIYGKTDRHSRAELIELLEECVQGERGEAQ